MSRGKLQEHDEFHYGQKRLLQPGDRFRVQGGPVYVLQDGTKMPMRERGIFRFLRYCTRGAAKWLEARRVDEGAVAILWVGRTMRSPTVPGLCRKPYRVHKVRGKRPRAYRKVPLAYSGP